MEQLKEEKLSDAMVEFRNQTVKQMRRLGFSIFDPNGLWTPKLTNEPIMDKDELNSRNGRCWFRKPGWSKSYWPFSDSPGVYLFFDGSHTACYVGKAEVAIGYRASAHAGSPGTDGSYSNCVFPEAVYLISIPLEAAPFLAPALESFLLSRYDFHYNKQLAGVKT